VARGRIEGECVCFIIVEGMQSLGIDVTVQ